MRFLCIFTLAQLAAKVLALAKLEGLPSKKGVALGSCSETPGGGKAEPREWGGGEVVLFCV